VIYFAFAKCDISAYGRSDILFAINSALAEYHCGAISLSKKIKLA
jgi:hypothetical protein